MKYVTDKMFYKYLRCPHWVYWDIYGADDERREEREILKKIREHSVVDEQEYLSFFGQVATVPATGDLRETMDQTVALMKDGAAAIFRGCLLDGHWVGQPDVLGRARQGVGLSSRLGGWIYEPYIIKNALIREEADLRDEYRFELAFVALILEKIQGQRPEHGYVIAADKTVHPVAINAVLENFHLTLREIENILDGKKPAPFLSSACKESPWFSKCVREAEACDDICLIYKIRRPDHAKLYAAGIKTVTELAGAEIDTLTEAVPEMSRRKLTMLQRQAVALHEKKAIVIQKPAFAPARPEYYFDIEGDPLRGLHYLFGLLEVKSDRAKGLYRRVAAFRPADEKKCWREFLKLAAKIPADAPIYHYGTYEKTVVSYFAKKYGGNIKIIDRLEKNMVNLLTIVCESVALPVYFYSLKDIAKEMGFKWRHAEASGINSIVWYEEQLRLVATGKKRDAVKAKKIMADIVAYNEDDVRATLFLKRRLAELPEPTET